MKLLFVYWPIWLISAVISRFTGYGERRLLLQQIVIRVVHWPMCKTTSQNFIYTLSIIKLFNYSPLKLTVCPGMQLYMHVYHHSEQLRIYPKFAGRLSWSPHICLHTWYLSSIDQTTFQKGIKCNDTILFICSKLLGNSQSHSI